MYLFHPIFHLIRMKEKDNFIKNVMTLKSHQSVILIKANEKQLLYKTTINVSVFLMYNSIIKPDNVQSGVRLLRLLVTLVELQNKPFLSMEVMMIKSAA